MRSAVRSRAIDPNGDEAFDRRNPRPFVLQVLGWSNRDAVAVIIGVLGTIAILANVLFLQSGPHPAPMLKTGLIPAIPAGAGTSVLSVLGGIGGSITMLSYNYWLREEKMVGPRWLKHVRKDIAVAYCFTALFGMSVMSIADQTFHVPAIKITDAQAVTKMAETLGSLIGTVGFYSYSIGFYAAVFASLPQPATTAAVSSTSVAEPCGR